MINKKEGLLFGEEIGIQDREEAYTQVPAVDSIQDPVVEHIQDLMVDFIRAPAVVYIQAPAADFIQVLMIIHT